MSALIVPLILGGVLMLAAAGPAHELNKRALGADETMQKVMEKGMVFASGVIDKLKDSEVAKKVIGKVLGAVAGGRATRSVSVGATLTNYNAAQYQKLELHKTFNNDATERKASSCPIEQNELNAIETVSIAVQRALVEVNRIINGRKMGFIIPKPNQIIV